MLARVIQEFSKGLQTIAESLSVVPASDYAAQARADAYPTQYSAQQNTNNVTAIAAPASGTEIAFVSIVLQNLTADTPSSFLLKNATSGATRLWEIPATDKGSGISEVWGGRQPIRWGDGNPLIIDVEDTAALHSIEISYIIVDVVTGMPV